MTPEVQANPVTQPLCKSRSLWQEGWGRNDTWGQKAGDCLILTWGRSHARTTATRAKKCPQEMTEVSDTTGGSGHQDDSPEIWGNYCSCICVCPVPNIGVPTPILMEPHTRMHPAARTPMAQTGSHLHACQQQNG